MMESSGNQQQGRVDALDPKRVEVEASLPIQDRRAMFPTWVDLLAILGLFYIGQMVARLLSFAIFAGVDEAELSQRVMEVSYGFKIFVHSVIALPLTLVLILIYRLLRGGSSWVKRGRMSGSWGSIHYSMRGFDPTILLWGVVMLLSMVVVIEPLMVLLPQSGQVMGRGVYMLLAVSIVAPIFEELICRGVILESIRAKRGAWVACVLSSLLFGLVHLTPQSMLNAFVIGLLLGFIYLRTNSIFAPMILHSINNLLSYLLLIFGLSEFTLSEFVGNQAIYMTIYFIACGVLLFSFIGISRYISTLDQADQKR